MARQVLKPTAGASLERDERKVEWELRLIWAQYRKVRLTLTDRCMVQTVMGIITRVSMTGAFVVLDGWEDSKGAALEVHVARSVGIPIFDRLGLKVKAERGLLECEFGDWTGAKLAELRKKPEWDTIQRHPSGFRFPGGESFAEMQTRMTTTLDRLASLHRGETVVAVSHADPIKAAVAHALGTHLDLFQRIVVSPCSVSAILVSAGPPIVLAVNSTGDDLKALVPS